MEDLDLHMRRLWIGKLCNEFCTGSFHFRGHIWTVLQATCIRLKHDRRFTSTVHVLNDRRIQPRVLRFCIARAETCSARCAS